MRVIGFVLGASLLIIALNWPHSEPGKVEFEYATPATLLDCQKRSLFEPQEDC